MGFITLGVQTGICTKRPETLVPRKLQKAESCIMKTNSSNDIIYPLYADCRTQPVKLSVLINYNKDAHEAKLLRVNFHFSFMVEL